MSQEVTQRPEPGQKTALVTGAGVGGIGGALATELHRQGYFVFCAVRRPESITELLKPGMAVVKIEVTSTESIEAAAAEVAAITGGTLDVLINNAGNARHRAAMDMDIDGVVRDLFDVNVLGPMRVVKAFGKQVIAAKGCIANIGSIAPILPLAFSSSYNSTKAAIHAYGETLSMELKPFGYVAQVYNITFSCFASFYEMLTKSQRRCGDSHYWWRQEQHRYVVFPVLIQAAFIVLTNHASSP